VPRGLPILKMLTLPPLICMCLLLTFLMWQLLVAFLPLVRSPSAFWGLFSAFFSLFNLVKLFDFLFSSSELSPAPTFLVPLKSLPVEQSTVDACCLGVPLSERPSWASCVPSRLCFFLRLHAEFGIQSSCNRLSRDLR